MPKRDKTAVRDTVHKDKSFETFISIKYQLAS